MKKKYRLYCVHTLLASGFMLLTIGCGSNGFPVTAPVETSNPNFAPIITSDAITTAQAEVPYSYTLTATDQNTDAVLTLSAPLLPSWLTFSPDSGELSGTPTESDVGEHDVGLIISDGFNEVSQEFTITVIEAPGNWVMVWSDEFDGASLNTENWNIETGDGSQYGNIGWGNNELEWYLEDNISVANGNLVIEAREETVSGYNYTSGRMRSDNKVDIKYGRIEARIQVPTGQGFWPAFWMLPTNSQYGGWASGGEVDIFEAVNPGTSSDDRIHGTLHYGMAWPMNVSSGSDYAIAPADDFHVYAIEWEEDQIRWFVDGIHYATTNSESWWSYYYAGLEQGYTSSPKAPFDQEFHLLLNLAVGGNWPGSPNAETIFPAQMLVDYVRIYECDSGQDSGAGCAANLNPEVVPPPAANVFSNRYSLYEEGPSTLAWQVGPQAVTRDLSVNVGWDNNGAINVTEQEIGGDQGLVLDIVSTDKGNVVINAADGETFNLYGMGDSARPWELAAGELKFDLFIDSAMTPNDSNLIVKIDSGFPALGFKEIAVADLVQDAWTTVSIPINDLLATPGDQRVIMTSIVNLFIVEFSAAAHIQLDNIELVCGHKEDNGCGINPPPIELNTESLDVFIEELNSDIWTAGIGAWDTTTNVDYFDGATANHVTWQVVDSGDAGHGNVVEVNFDSNGADGLIFFKSNQPIDLSELAEGKLIFDLRVTDYAATTSGISFKIDCIFPCTTGDQLIGVVADGEWETIEVEVSSLVNAGLNITSVNTGLVLFPTFGDQQGVSLQLDNIRWEKGVATPPSAGESVVIYADGIDSNWSLWDCCGGATVTEIVDDDATYGNVAEYAFNGVSTVAGVEASSPHNADGLTNGTLEFDLKLTSEPIDSSAEWLLKLESNGAATAVEVLLTTSNEGVAPTLDTWQHYTFNLDTLSGMGLDLSQLKLVMIFPTWSKSAGVIYRLDNLEIKTN